MTEDTDDTPKIEGCAKPLVVFALIPYCTASWAFTLCWTWAWFLGPRLEVTYRESHVHPHRADQTHADVAAHVGGPWLALGVTWAMHRVFA